MTSTTRNSKVLSNITKCILLFFIPHFLFAQEEDTTHFQEVTIKGNHQKIEQHTTLTKNEIQHISSNDLGGILQYITGLTIKSYGGIGGMKTLSHRGLGGEHSQLIIDGLPINNPQNGQTNLSNIQLNNVEEVGLNQQNTEQLIPVSGLIKGSSVQLKTFDQQFSNSKIAIRSNLTIGSFGQKEAYLGFKKSNKKTFISATGGYRTYDGEYPYQLPFGDESIKYRRNNALENYHFSVGGGLRWKKNVTIQKLKFSAKRNVIQQELPGAVIIYNDLASETLETEVTSLGLNYTLLNRNLMVKAFATYNNHYIHYNDPTYLNSDGFLDNKYTTNSIISGFHTRYKWNNFDFNLGHDINFDVLESSRNIGQPERMTNTSMLKLKYNTTFFNVAASAFYQSFIDANDIQTHRNSYYKLHPQLSVFTSDSLFKNLQLSIWYKPSSRAPTFNELYYSQIGNKDLSPEESSQINFGARYIKQIKKTLFQIQGNVFKNKVDNKIIALPTQNLFVWSIQNIGTVDILGGDLHITSRTAIRKNWKLNFQAGASFQNAIDVSDEHSPTYRDQIAYTPKITGNAMASVHYKKAGLYFTSLYIGERYSLNENSNGNRLDPYLIFDLSASYNFKLNKNQNIKLQAGVKNVGDISYNFIKYYVMPGRNYFLKLSYEFN